MKILVDMNLSPEWVAMLNSEGFYAVHWSEIGAGNAPDVELFNWARENKDIIFTHDLDFGTLLALTALDSPSVFQIRGYDVTPKLMGARVIDLLRQFDNELSNAALLVIDQFRERVRLLPLLHPNSN